MFWEIMRDDIIERCETVWVEHLCVSVGWIPQISSFYNRPTAYVCASRRTQEDLCCCCCNVGLTDRRTAQHHREVPFKLHTSYVFHLHAIYQLLPAAPFCHRTPSSRVRRSRAVLLYLNKSILLQLRAFFIPVIMNCLQCRVH